MSLFYEQNKAKLERLIDDATSSSGATILIPNLQRAYVWEPDDVVLLIDSLIKGWPFGALLFWAVEPANAPNTDNPPMPKRSFWSLESRVNELPSQGLPEARGLTPYRMVLDGQQRLQSLILALKGVYYGFQLCDHDWARSLEMPTRKETQHWSRGCLCVDLALLNSELARCKGILEWVEFKRVLQWIVLDPKCDISTSRGKQKSPLRERQLGDPLIPLAKFWELALVSHVRMANKYDASLASLFSEYQISNFQGYSRGAELLLDKLAELKATDVHYLEVLPFSAAFDLDHYNDSVINIFARLNSAGRTLEPEEITFAWLKSSWQPADANGNRSADKCFEELAEQLEGGANLALDVNQLVRGVSAIWAAMCGDGTLLEERDFLKAEKLKPMASDMAALWNVVATAVQAMSSRISNLGLRYRETYYSLNALFVLWALETVITSWRGRARLKNLDSQAFDQNYDALLSKNVDRWFLLSQWAGAWAQASNKEFEKYLKQIAALRVELNGITDGDSALAQVEGLLHQWLDGFKAPARQFIENLNAVSRASVRQYFGPLWIWNRLNQERWNIAMVHLREWDRRKSKLLETDVDHIVSVRLWEVKTKGQLPPDDAALVINSIGNCCQLERTFNISKSAEPAYDFFRKVNEFRQKPTMMISLVRHFRLPGTLLRPSGRDKQRLANLIQIREKKIKAELVSYVDGALERQDR